MSDAGFDYRRCPRGGVRTFWRKGVGFDHERRCACGKKYDPHHEERKYLAAEAERLSYNTSRE